MFMRKEIESAKGAVRVTTDLGEVYYLPSDTQDGEDVSMCRPEMVMGNVVTVERLESGYLGRRSAPGYLDCTDWEYDTNKRRLESSL